MSLKAVKNKIKSIDKTRQVTKAMESVSAVKMRKSQASAIGVRPYALSAFKILRSISGSIDATNHPLTLSRPVKHTLLIIISGDKGLAGSYGSTLLKQTYRFMAEKSLTIENTSLICIGKKGYEHLVSYRGFQFKSETPHYQQQLKHPCLHSINRQVQISAKSREQTI